jgi:hypothetical protein
LTFEIRALHYWGRGEKESVVVGNTLKVQMDSTIIQLIGYRVFTKHEFLVFWITIVAAMENIEGRRQENKV